MALLAHCFSITDDELYLLNEVSNLGKNFKVFGVLLSKEGNLISITESDMNKAIRCLTEYAENVYLGEHPGGNIDLATGLTGAFRRCLAIGVVN